MASRSVSGDTAFPDSMGLNETPDPRLALIGRPGVEIARAKNLSSRVEVLKGITPRVAFSKSAAHLSTP